jgi:hypothetical protein
MLKVLVVAAGVLWRIVLFVVLAALAMISCNLLLLVFFGAASFTLVGFGLFPATLPASISEMQGLAFYVYPVTAIIAGIAAINLAWAMVGYTYHKNVDVLEMRIKYVVYAIVWMTQTIIWTAVLSFIVILFVAVIRGDFEQGPELNFHAVVQDARYFLLAALIASGIIAERSVSYKQA